MELYIGSVSSAKMTDTLTVVVALIAASPGILSAYYASQAKKASVEAKTVSIANGASIAEVARQTDGVTEKLVSVEKKLSFKKGVAAGKKRTGSKS
jgi:hypothetical protein